jgi:hypothetical protein
MREQTEIDYELSQTMNKIWYKLTKEDFMCLYRDQEVLTFLKHIRESRTMLTSGFKNDIAKLMNLIKIKIHSQAYSDIIYADLLKETFRV